jgi:hypothetical protein
MTSNTTIYLLLKGNVPSQFPNNDDLHRVCFLAMNRFLNGLFVHCRSNNSFRKEEMGVTIQEDLDHFQSCLPASDDPAREGDVKRSVGKIGNK